MTGGGYSQRRAPGRVAIVVAAAGACIASWQLFEQLARPWVWFSVLWALIFGLAAYLVQSAALRSIWITSAAALLAVGAAEAWLSAEIEEGPEERFEGRYTEDYYTGHDQLGYGPNRGASYSVRRFVNGEIVYDTSYGINQDGLRVTPVPADGAAQKEVLFFGGSVTFGEGVADHESMPYQVGALAEGTHRVHNFGFHGYGPHQMLATLEFALYDRSVGGEVSHVIYQALPEHVARTLGAVPWDRHGPWYRENDQGQVEFAGSFADRHSSLFSALQPLLERSILYQRLFGLQRAWTENDAALYLAVVARARDLAQQRFPGSAFHVIFWDRAGYALSDQIRDGLERAGIPYHLVSDILPNFSSDHASYQIGEFEHHPNARAHGLIAGYVAEEILKAGPK